MTILRLLILAAITFAPKVYSADRNNIIIFVADGLRGGSVNAKDTPAFERVRTQGVRFDNSHAVFPTVTTVNASVIALGHGVGDTGNFSNDLFAGYTLFADRGDGTATSVPNLENDEVLKELKAHYGRDYLGETSLLAWARKHGISTAAMGKTGPTLIQNIELGSLIGATQSTAIPSIVLDTTTGPLHGVPLSESLLQAMQRQGLPESAPCDANTTKPRILSQKYFTDVFLKVVLPQFAKAQRPFVAIFWCADPDATQHDQCDSLNRFSPGINGKTSLEAIKIADRSLGRILSYLDAHPKLAESTNVIVTADHGFSTISKKWLNADRTIATASYSAQFAYRNSNGEVVTQKGFLPTGFLAIDLAHALNMRLFDPNGKPVQRDGMLIYPEVDPRGKNGFQQYPVKGNALIGSKDSRAEIVVANGRGSSLIYLTRPNPKLASSIVSFLSSQDYIGGIFADKKQCGKTPGALDLKQVFLKGSAKLPVPAIIASFRTFALDPAHPTQSQISISDTVGREGQGSHGSFGRGDTFNFMAAMGPDFKKGYVDAAPVSNTDIPVTCAQILHLRIPSIGKLRGRVIEEALVGGPKSIAVKTGTLKSQPTASGLATQARYQEAQGHRYFDAAGFPGRSVGIE